VLRTDDRGEFGVEHLTHHHQPSRGGERQQTISHRASHISHRDGRFERQALQADGLWWCRDLHDGYLLGHGDPSLSSVLDDPRTLPATAELREGSPPHFNRPRDNVRRSSHFPIRGPDRTIRCAPPAGPMGATAYRSSCVVMPRPRAARSAGVLALASVAGRHLRGREPSLRDVSCVRRADRSSELPTGFRPNEPQELHSPKPAPPDA
jgi:hypothetical protein